MALFDNPAVHEILKTSGPTALLAILGWAAWWYERKANAEMERRLFKLSAAQAQHNTRTEAALRALRELVRERLLGR